MMKAQNVASYAHNRIREEAREAFSRWIEYRRKIKLDAIKI
jgi:hypothetical protein